MEENIVSNPSFKMGLLGWYGNSCTALVSDGGHYLGGTKMEVGEFCCVVTDRKEAWQGLEQNISARLKVNMKYNVTAVLGISSSFQSTADVIATLRLESPSFPTKYIFIGRVETSIGKWFKLQGSFCIDTIPEKAIFYIEGPPAGVNILVSYVDIRSSRRSEGNLEAMHKHINQADSSPKEMDLVLRNPEFEEGLQHWSGKGCKITLHGSSRNVQIHPSKGRHFVAATNRTSGWQGVEQEVTGRLKCKTKYEVSATVRIGGGIPSAEVLASLWIKTLDLQERYITLGKVKALSTSWVQLRGNLLLNSTPTKATAYIEGPPAGIDLLVDSFFISPVVKPPPVPPVIEDPKFGVNIVENSNLMNGLTGWHTVGSCSLALDTGAPLVLPPAARNTLGVHLPVTGYYIIAKNRKYIWEGPAQTITEKLQLYLTYQVSAWVRIGYGGSGAQKVNVALGVDNQWVNGGEVEGDPESWIELAGSFRFEKKPENVLLYVQGPSPGVDLMVANLQIFAVDRKARFATLKAQTEKIRKRDVVLKVKGQDGHPFSNGALKIEQRKNSFPLGSCINRYSLENESYVQFFLNHFNWAVFENEIKWGWTEQQQGKLNYRDADVLCDFCIRHGIPARGHCIFWETECAVQDWLKNLSHNELAAAVQDRVTDLVSRYKGKFQHYDVNNEMLHGSFYKDKLGLKILPYMFKLTNQFDPSAKLFVNDYHVVDGCDAHSSPEKYIHQILDLQAQGAPVGGIGLQGHVSYPIGAIIGSALDKLAMVGLPIWFTEVDVASSNEYLRSEDLEVVLREAYAHPAVEGIMLWGFWETAMHRELGHLVDVDGTINEAGKMLVALKQEWQSSFEGYTDDMGHFYFSGYHGAYTVVVNTCAGQVKKDFEVGKGDSSLIVDVQF